MDGEGGGEGGVGDIGGGGGAKKNRNVMGGGQQRGGFGGCGGFETVRSSYVEDFIPDLGDAAGLLLYDMRVQLQALDRGEQSYRDFLKCLELVTQGVLTPDDFSAMMYDKMISGTSQMKYNFVHLKNLMGARPAVYPAISEVDLTHCAKIGVSYKKLPKDYLPPLCSGRGPMWNQVLNDEWVSVSSGREDFGQMKRTQYEVAMFLCEDDRYELDMLVELNLSTMRAITARLAELPQSEREPTQGGAAEEDRDEGENLEVEEDLHQIQRVRTLRERPPTNDNLPDEETPVYFQGELLKARHMKIIQMVYGDNWPEIAALMRRAPGVTLRVVLKRLQRRDIEWRKTRRDMNRIWSTVYHNNYHKSLDFRSFQFKQADKKALSPAVLQHEAILLRTTARRATNKEPHSLGTATYAGDGMVCSSGGDFIYDLHDDQVH